MSVKAAIHKLTLVNVDTGPHAEAFSDHGYLTPYNTSFDSHGYLLRVWVLDSSVDECTRDNPIHGSRNDDVRFEVTWIASRLTL